MEKGLVSMEKENMENNAAEKLCENYFYHSFSALLLRLHQYLQAKEPRG
jgi:hypothetical protein